jgi:hypothetical protein
MKPNIGADQCGSQLVEQMWSQQKNTKKKFRFGDYVVWFPKEKKTYLGKSKKRRFGPFRVQYCLPNNIVFLVFCKQF